VTNQSLRDPALGCELFRLLIVKTLDVTSFEIFGSVAQFKSEWAPAPYQLGFRLGRKRPSAAYGLTAEGLSGNQGTKPSFEYMYGPAGSQTSINPAQFLHPLILGNPASLPPVRMK